MMLLGTRPAEQAKTPALVAELVADPVAIAMHPAVLGQRAVIAVALDRFGIEPDPVFAEALLIGKKVTPELAEEAGVTASQECSPTSDLRGSELYKRAIVRTLVRRAVGKAYERAL